MNEPLVEVQNLKQYFPVRSGFKTLTLKAVDDISFTINKGETLGLVGESGCGKTTAGRSILRLYERTHSHCYSGSCYTGIRQEFLTWVNKRTPTDNTSKGNSPYVHR